MEICVNRNIKENNCKRKQKLKIKEMDLSKPLDMFQMSWSQKGHNIYIVLTRIDQSFNLKSISITLTDQSCTLIAPGMKKYGWDFFLEVNSKSGYTNQNDEKLIIILPKKDTTLRWPSFFKSTTQTNMNTDQNSNDDADFSDEQPPEKMMHTSSNEKEFLVKNEVPSANVTMSTGTVVTNGILKGGNRPVLGSLNTGASTGPSSHIDQFPSPESNNATTNSEYVSLHYLKDVENEWVESGENGIVFLMHVANIDPWSITIKFIERKMIIKFKTGCLKFHEKHKTDTDATFCWKIQLSGNILKDKCEHRANIDKLTILLYKKEKVKWKTLFCVSQENKAKGDAEITEPSKSNISNNNVQKSKTDSVQKYTGLQNLGNTCFLNSVLQCLANTRELKEYFLDKRYKDDLNYENPLGMKGKMAESFYLLLQEISSGKHKCFAPSRFRQTVGLKAPQFNDYMQHDAQEFMAWLLDILHEDVNRVLKKPYYEIIEREENDFVVAAESWKLHTSRNDSFIVDLFHGMLKSKLICPKCNKHSIKFDPFLFLPVPLPSVVRHLDVIFQYKEPPKEPVKISIWIPKTNGTCEKILEEVSKVTGVNQNKMRIYEVYNNQVHKLYSPISTSDKILSTDVIFIQEMLTLEDCDEEVYEIFVNQRKNAPDIPEQCVFCKKRASEGSIKRCLRCYKVGYCDQECQKSDWPHHKNVCKRVLEKVGLPFIAFIPHSKATFTYIVNLFNILAKKSIQVSYYEKDKDTNNVTEIKNPTTYDNSFTLIPISWSGQNLSNLPVIKPADGGYNEVLDLSKYVVVGMDWHTDPKPKNFVKVANRPLKYPSLPTQPPSVPNLYDCLQLFTEPEILTPDEAWYCPSCKEHREATKQLSLWQLPDLLIIQLKRFSFKNFLWRDKITTLVDFPIRGLDMTSYCKNGEDYIYDLHSVVNHHGGIFGGHYTSYVYSGSDSKWRVCDDSNISVMNSNDVVTKVAYVMFYQRRKPTKINILPNPTIKEKIVNPTKSEIDPNLPSTSKAQYFKNTFTEKNVSKNENYEEDKLFNSDKINNNLTPMSMGISEQKSEENENFADIVNKKEIPECLVSDNNNQDKVTFVNTKNKKELPKDDSVLQETEIEINHMEIGDNSSKINDSENICDQNVSNDIHTCSIVKLSDNTAKIDTEFTDMDEID